MTQAAGAAVLAVAMLATAATPAAAAATPAAATATPAAADVGTSNPVPPQGQHGSLPGGELRAALNRVTDAGMVGAFAEVRDDRATWRGASGTADLDTGRPMRPGLQHRIGSITKTLVATAVLQLVGEGRVALDAPVGTYLPEFAVDGVTVRMLLNHTSGIGTYDRALFVTPEDVVRHANATFDPHELARIGLDLPPTNAPGAGYAYSNTNYILAGLILEEVTGRPAQSEIYRRIIRPLGLWQTYFPGTHARIVGPHAKGYVPWYEGELRDFSVYNMSWASTAGALISTPADVNQFFRALLGGRLLGPAELAQMRAIPASGGYGLGLVGLPLPCGTVWGHDGMVFGHSMLSLHSADGRRQVTFAANLTHYWIPGEPDPISAAMFDFAVTALCGPNGGANSGPNGGTGDSTGDSPSLRGTTADPLPMTPAPGGPALTSMSQSGQPKQG